MNIYISILRKDLSNIVNSYLLPNNMKTIFNQSLLLIENTKNLLYIETYNDNIRPHTFKSPIFSIIGSNITFKENFIEIDRI